MSCIPKWKEKVQNNTQFSFWWEAKSSSYEIDCRSSSSCSAANSVGTSFEFATFGSGADAKYSRASAFGFFFLSPTMVFAVVRTHFPRKNTHVLIDQAANDKQLDRY